MANLQFGPRRSVVLNACDESPRFKFAAEEIKHFEFLDLVYRTLVAVLYNYAPTSGHPGGSISSGRFVERLLFDTMTYDFSAPDETSADLISYSAGHKALGMYAMWALRNEIVRISQPTLLPDNEKYQLRLEDLLGFRRNAITATPLFKKYNVKALDGHPTPATPFLRIATGASGYGINTTFGLALSALDFYGANNSPMVHAIEGEGGMTPGRVAEGFAFASASGLKNMIVHLDWNQSSIDSDRVCREGNDPGDYVQWEPLEYAHLHDWNVIMVPDGKDFQQIFTAQKLLAEIENNQPTMIVYRTIKGWKYGITGRASHGSGHKFCSDDYCLTLQELSDVSGMSFPRFNEEATPENIEKSYFETLMVIRGVLEKHRDSVDFLASKLVTAKNNLTTKNRAPRSNAPEVETIYDAEKFKAGSVPTELELKIGEKVTLREVLGNVLNHYNQASKGAIFSAAADLLGSTSVMVVNKSFPAGFWHSETNNGSRLLSIGGICEDAIGSVISGISSFSKQIGVGSSYAAFIAALHHVTMRMHGIAQQARVHVFGGKYNPFITVCGHSGLKTGEDGPSHADPQALQLLQENFPKGIMITLTPWDPQEIWPLMTTALQLRPAIIAPFVTRPQEMILDRVKYKLPPAVSAIKGIYPLRSADKNKKSGGTIILQESAVTYAFVENVLLRLDEQGLNLNIFYISSVELFDALPIVEQEQILPEELRREAMGITGFTLATLYRFVTSKRGQEASLHPFKHGYNSSGSGAMVIKEAGLDGESQYQAILNFVKGNN
jgi:transketolase